MNPIKSIIECDKYVMYIADALWQLSTQFKVSRMDREILENYSKELVKLHKNLNDTRNNWIMEEEKKKRQLNEEN